MRPDPETVALLDVCSILGEFECVIGDPKAYHTTSSGEMYRYTTLGFRGAELHEVAAALRATLQTLRQSLAQTPIPILYRRSGPEIEQDPESGDWKMRMRVAIPGADWSKVVTKPEGLPFPRTPLRDALQEALGEPTEGPVMDLRELVAKYRHLASRLNNDINPLRGTDPHYDARSVHHYLSELLRLRSSN